MCQDKVIGSNIKRARYEAGIKQADFAAALGIPLRTMQRIEQGRGYLSMDTLQRIAAAQHKRLDWYTRARGDERRRVRKTAINSDS